MRFRSIAFGLAVLPTMLSQSASAHHSLSAYDIGKRVVVSGTIKRFEWSSPHCWLFLTSVDGKGATVEWSLEAGTPIVNTKFGWTRSVFKPGQKVKITAAPVRDGSAHGALIMVEFPDGRKLAGPLATYLKQQ